MSELKLKSLSMKNFKCFKDLSLDFGRLTVLSGYSGAGKSTAVQPILLLSQMLNDSNRKSNDFGKYWPLNGNLIRLGTGGEVLNEFVQENIIQFDYKFYENIDISCKFRVDTGNDSLFSVKNNLKSLNSLKYISELSFVSALRGSDENVYPRKYSSNYSKVNVGKDGRFACFLYDRLIDERDEFRFEVDEWLNKIVSGINAVVVPFSSKKIFELKFQDSKSSFTRMPTNIGYGLTYAFPIIVATLASQKGDIIVIDSPESHLHPKAQSFMGQKLAQIAAGREVQIIVETHSDHVLNGIRLAVKAGKLDPEDLSILFFSDVEDEEKRISRPLIDRNGSLSEWPVGFFDQILVDNIQLTGVT